MVGVFQSYSLTAILFLDIMEIMEEAMSWLWKRLAKKNDRGEEFILWTHADLEEMYHNGFVDTDKFTKEQWTKAFQSSRTPEGRYQITKDQWLEKNPFRYSGKVSPP